MMTMIQITKSCAPTMKPNATSRPGLSQSELDNARAQNRQADGEINDLWGGMDSDVKQQILGEQTRLDSKQKTQLPNKPPRPQHNARTSRIPAPAV